MLLLKNISIISKTLSKWPQDGNEPFSQNTNIFGFLFHVFWKFLNFPELNLPPTLIVKPFQPYHGKNFRLDLFFHST